MLSDNHNIKMLVFLFVVLLHFEQMHIDRHLCSLIKIEIDKTTFKSFV